MPVHFISSCTHTCSAHKCVTGIQQTQVMFQLIRSSFDYWEGIGQAENAAALLACAVRKPWCCLLWNQTLTPGSRARTSDQAPHHAAHGLPVTAQLRREGHGCHTQGHLLLPTSSRTAPEESAASGMGKCIDSMGTLRFWTQYQTAQKYLVSVQVRYCNVISVVLGPVLSVVYPTHHLYPQSVLPPLFKSWGEAACSCAKWWNTAQQPLLWGQREGIWVQRGLQVVKRAVVGESSTWMGTRWGSPCT